MLKMEHKIFKKKCPICGKQIVSLYENQLEYNFKQHLESHEREESLSVPDLKRDSPEEKEVKK